jgi:branched-chain amino acid transport system substrate-binding protein
MSLKASISMRRFLLVVCLFLAMPAQAGTIKIAIDAEFGIPGSTSAQAILHGAQVAVNEINAAGGVLGKPLEIIQRDYRGGPARALNNLRELAADPQVVAVMGGKYSPTVVELLPEIHRLKIPFLNPWAAADPITEHGFSPDYVFRLSLRDTWAIQKMMQHAARRSLDDVALILPNSAWGRSNLLAAQAYLHKHPGQKLVAYEWFNFGDKQLDVQYRNLLAAGAQAIILVANEQEGVVFVNEMATLPQAKRLPVIAHWGITAGRFYELTQEALDKLDVVVVQTYSFIGKRDPVAKRVLKGLKQVSGNDDPRKVVSPVGVAHAYDMVHLLARAIDKAGNTDRAAIRSALEQLGPYPGVTRHFARPFTPARHEALGEEYVFLARFAADGAIEPLPVGKR